ncbi:MAG: hypothetical protein M9894_20480 [Planctomycetes bacterium]|nr:hypothetical protein [Planctomycetota bacterium]
MTTILRALALVAGLASLACAQAPGDVDVGPGAWDQVHLRDGRILRGSVRERDGALVLLVPQGQTLLAPEDVARIERRHDPLDELDLRRAAGHPQGTVAQRLAYGQLCLALGMRAEGHAALRAVLALDPDHERARSTLGFVRHDGEWMPVERWRQRQELAVNDGRAPRAAPAPREPQPEQAPAPLAAPAAALVDDLEREVDALRATLAAVSRATPREETAVPHAQRGASHAAPLVLGFTPQRRVIGANIQWTQGSQRLAYLQHRWRYPGRDRQRRERPGAHPHRLR